MEYEKNTWYWLKGDSSGYIPVYFNSFNQFKIAQGAYLSLDDFHDVFGKDALIKAVMPE